MDSKAVALGAWSVAHGLAMLMLDGQIPADETIIDAVISVPPAARPRG